MTNSGAVDRRGFLERVAVAIAVGSEGSLGRSPGQTPSAITRDVVSAAEKILGLEFTDAERDLLVDDLNAGLAALTALHGTTVPNEVVPALSFQVEVPGVEALPPRSLRRTRPAAPVSRRPIKRPRRPEDLAFLGVVELGSLLRRR